MKVVVAFVSFIVILPIVLDIFKISSKANPAT